MPRITRQRCLILIAGAYLTIICFVSADSRRAGSVSDRSRPFQKSDAKNLTKLYFGVTACSTGGCHTDGKQKEQFVCRYDEFNTWTEKDKHKDAHKVLTEPRAQNMAKLLGIAEVTKDARCISCHSVLADDKLKHESFKLEEGVSCVACHGPYTEWVSKHLEFLFRPKWRTFSREKKENEFGMRDLWDPAKRAALCATCHIGNLEEKKIVTHEMYAAGHPPLPGLEVAFFSQAMPRHWDYLAEKKAEIQKLFAFDAAKNNLERTELVLLAGLVSFRETMNLIAAQAESKSPDQAWPELAHFDCYACHHDLKSKSWRQQRGYAGKPGRPNMRAWPLTLVHLGLTHLGDNKAEADFRANLKKLTDAYDMQPFGEPAPVASAARGLAAWADQASVELRKKRIDKPAVRSLILVLGDISKSKILDYDSARQVAWAFDVMHQELDPSLAADGKIKEGFAKLEEILKLKLPQGQERIETHLPEFLRRIADYEPGQFQQAMAGLTERIRELTK